LLASAALAQNTGNSGGNTQSLPVGQPFKQFTFPVYGPDGQLHYSFFAVTATGVTINRAEADDLTIDVYENGQKTTTITSPKADLYVTERKMRTTNTVRIERSDMEATSQDCDFSATTKIYFLRTNVKVLLKHFDIGASSRGPGSTAPTPPPPPAAALPAPASSTSTPTDDSILSSPGAYSEKSDKNSAPLPPANSPTQ